MSFWFALITIVAIIIYRKKLSEKQQDKINRILAVVILIVMLAYRICVPVGYILIDHNEAYNWWVVLPNGLCGFTCMLLPISTLIKPRNNAAYHCFVYLALIGAVVTLIYPVEYYKNFNFFHPYAFFGMLYHGLALMLCILLIVTKSFRPNLRKWWVMPLSYALILIFGAFELFVLGIPHAMNLDRPLFDAMPILSSWYGCGICATLTAVLVAGIYELAHKKKNPTRYPRNSR